MRALRSASHRLALWIATKALVLAIGLVLACIAASIALGSHQLHRAMSVATQGAFDAGNHTFAAMSFVGLRLGCVMIATALVLWSPSAAGSGLPQIKANLNGADIGPNFLSWRTLAAKAIGITLVVATGIPL